MFTEKQRRCFRRNSIKHLRQAIKEFDEVRNGIAISRFPREVQGRYETIVNNLENLYSIMKLYRDCGVDF